MMPLRLPLKKLLFLPQPKLFFQLLPLFFLLPEGEVLRKDGLDLMIGITRLITLKNHIFVGQKSHPLFLVINSIPPLHHMRLKFFHIPRL